MSICELPGAIKVPIKITIFLGSLSALIWRLSDLVEEASVGAVKMSMGAYHISGNGAILVQVLIIGVLAFMVFITYKNILQACTYRSQD
jgi:hypothetical protein